MNLDVPALWVQGWPYLEWGLRAAVVVLGGLLVGWLLARMLRGWSERFARPLGAGRASLVGRSVWYLTFGAACVVVLRALEVPLDGMVGWVAGAAGIAGVAIGFASQTSATNIISGLFLLGERPFEEGDIVSIDGLMGEVLAVDLLSVKMRTFDNLYVRVPNETMMRAIITNLSRFPIRRIDLIYRFRADAPLDRVRVIVVETAVDEPSILVDPAPIVLFQGVMDGGIELQLSAWTTGGAFASAKAAWALSLLRAFHRDGIEVVGAQRTVRVERDAVATSDDDAAAGAS